MGARSLFCFSVFTQDTGSPKQSYELELLTQQLERKVSLFACDAYDVYSDVEVSLGGGVMTKKVTDVKGDWHFAKRKEKISSLRFAWLQMGSTRSRLSMFPLMGRAQLRGQKTKRKTRSGSQTAMSMFPRCTPSRSQPRISSASTQPWHCSAAQSRIGSNSFTMPRHPMMPCPHGNAAVFFFLLVKIR